MNRQRCISLLILIISKGILLAQDGPLTHDHPLSFSNSKNSANIASIAFNQPLYFDVPEDEIFSGDISGAKEVVKQGLGTLTLTGDVSSLKTLNVLAGNLSILNPFSKNTEVLAFSNKSLLQVKNKNLTLGISKIYLTGPVFVDVEDHYLTIKSDILGPTGRLVKINSGTLILKGNNGYGNGTIISGGSSSVLSISQDANLGMGGLTLDGATIQADGPTVLKSTNIIINGASRFDTNYTTFTINSNISGTGTLIKVKEGILNLTGINTYSGETNVNGGILCIHDEQNLGISNSLLMNGGILQAGKHNPVNLSKTNIQLKADTDIDTNGSDLYIESEISGIGKLTKVQPGSLILKGNNTYSGGTVVKAGILGITNDANLGGLDKSLSLMPKTTLRSVGEASLNTTQITLSGEVFFDTAEHSLTIASEITGAGSLNKVHESSLILKGKNSYSGGTIVSAGTLHGNTYSIQGDIVNRALVKFDISNQESYNGNISGPGSVDIISGQLTLLGSNTYSGGTTVFPNSSLQGSTNSVQGNIINNGTVVFDQLEAGTYLGMMEGSGNVDKKNKGTLTFNNKNFYTGLTTITEGALVITGSITSDVVISKHGTLAGTGTISGCVTNKGVISPGNSIGTLTILGSINFEPGSVYAEKFDPNTNDLLIATKKITISPEACLELVLFPGVYPHHHQMTIIQSTEEIVGNFSTIQNQFPLISASVNYTPHSVLLQLSALPLTNLVNSGSSGVLAQCLSQTIPDLDSDLAIILSQLRMATSASQLRGFLNQMLPVFFKGFLISQQNNMMSVQDSINQRIEEVCRSYLTKKVLLKKHHIWASSFADITKQSSFQKQVGFSTLTGGGIIGCDHLLTDTFKIGSSIAYTHTKVSWKSYAGKGLVESYYCSLYGIGLTHPHLIVTSGLTGAYNCYEANRFISIANLHRRASHHNKGWEGAAYLNLTAPFQLSKIDFLPYISSSYIFTQEDGYREIRAQDLNLKVRKNHASYFHIEQGINLSGRIFRNEWQWQPYIKMGVIEQIQLRGRDVAVSLKRLNCWIHLKAPNLNKILFAPGAGISIISPGEKTTFSVRYEAQWGDRWLDQKGRIQWIFAF